MKSASLKTGILVWFSVVCFYLYQYILRVSPSVMANDIMADWGIDACAFGSLSAIATYSYASLQIPAGILSDLYGTRRMVLVSILLCFSGVTFFALSDNLLLAYVGRFMIGAGSAAAFLCVSKVASDWFPADKKAMMFALTVTMGTVGALLGGKPLTFMTQTYGWRQALLILSAAGCVILVINFLVIKDKIRSEDAHLDKKDLKKTILSVFKSKVCWTYAIIATGIYLFIAVFADLWGVSFLMLKFNISKGTAAEMISIMYVGMCIGCLTVAVITQKFINRNTTLLAGALLSATFMAILIYVPGLNVSMATTLLFLAGLTGGVEVLCFSSACESMNISVAATVTGFVNFIVTLGAAIMQQQVGFTLDLLWDHTVGLDGVPIYAVSDYQGAMFIVIFACFSSAFLLFFNMIKERRQQEIAR